MTNLTVITPPAGEPVSLPQAKAYLRIGHDSEDTLVGDLIASARAQVEQTASLAMVVRQVQRTWACWPAGAAQHGIRLTPGPVRALLALRTVDEAGDSTDHADQFELLNGRLRLKPWRMLPEVPDGGRIEVEFETGFGTAADVPEDLLLALKLTLSDAYARGRQARSPVPDRVMTILEPYRGVRL